jgi:hypothetical protein
MISEDLIAGKTKQRILKAETKATKAILQKHSMNIDGSERNLKSMKPIYCSENPLLRSKIYSPDAFNYILYKYQIAAKYIS